jgi:hypothetical protein
VADQAEQQQDDDKNEWEEFHQKNHQNYFTTFDANLSRVLYVKLHINMHTVTSKQFNNYVVMK